MKFTVIASGSSGNCYVLEGRDSALIIECGVRPERVFRETSVVPSRVAGCLVSHEHNDHAGYAERFAALGIRILASGGTLLNTKLPRTARVTKLVAMETCILGEYIIRPFRVDHDAVEPLGFLIEHPEAGRILFVTDAAGVAYSFREWCPDHILVEANYADDVLTCRVIDGEVTPERATRVRRTHMSLRGALEFIRANETPSLKTVTLIHLSDENSDAENFASMAAKTALFATVRVAAPGVSFEMNLREI